MVGVRLCGYRSVQLQRSRQCCCVLVWYLQKGAGVISSLIIRINKNRQYWRMNSKGNYKTYCFEHLGNIMFFYYNHNHPIMMKNYKFELGKVKIFTESGMVFNCQITSNPHLNIVLDWNEEYFAKLFHGLSIFELQLTVDQCEEITSLVVRDHFQKEEEIFLMRAKLILQPGFDKINEFWTTFKNYNLEKIKGIQNMQKEGAEMRGNADEQLMKLMDFQEGKQVEKRKLKGQISALLRQKQAKLRQFNESFNYYGQNKQIQLSYDLSEQKDSQSIAGSLFQESQQFMFQN